MTKKNNTRIRVPNNDTEIQTMLEIRLLAAEKAYSTVGHVSPEEVRSELSKDNPRIHASIEAGNFQAIYTQVGKRIIGMCVWNKQNTTMNMLEHLYVLPEEQGKGYGSSMLDMALQDMGNSKSIKLTTQDAQKLYESRGFITTDEWDTDRINSEQIMIRPATDQS